MNIQREMTIDSLEEMCDLMCGGIEEDYEDEELVDLKVVRDEGEV